MRRRVHMKLKDEFLRFPCNDSAFVNLAKRNWKYTSEAGAVTCLRCLRAMIAGTDRMIDELLEEFIRLKRRELEIRMGLKK